MHGPAPAAIPARPRLKRLCCCGARGSAVLGLSLLPAVPTRCSVLLHRPPCSSWTVTLAIIIFMMPPSSGYPPPDRAAGGRKTKGGRETWRVLDARPKGLVWPAAVPPDNGAIVEPRTIPGIPCFRFGSSGAGEQVEGERRAKPPDAAPQGAKWCLKRRNDQRAECNSCHSESYARQR
eukprot:gene11928-biopygen7896